MILAAALLFAAGVQAKGLDLPKPHLPAKPKPDAVLAKVGGAPIRASDVEAFLWDWRAYEAVQDVVAYQMVAGEAKRLGITVPPAEIQKELDRQLELVKRDLKAGQTLTSALQEQGFSKSRLYLRVRGDLLLTKIAAQGFDPKGFVKVSTIVIRPKSEQSSDLADALKRAEDAYTALKDGEPWKEVLARHSDSPSAIQTGGVLGWRDLTAFPPTVRQEIATLAPGGITKPAMTTGVVQIFRIEALGSKAQGAVLEELKTAVLAVSRQKILADLRKRIPVQLMIGK